ncbi:phosphotransferase [Marinobacter mangrovi]|uniref:phosphotransferase n=1 Tax=Marinobacter mangrovi TaxID=2803918 RepID=UPI001933F172|nr:phosphotransferase [Marinobacter mangrovi]
MTSPPSPDIDRLLAPLPEDWQRRLRHAHAARVNAGLCNEVYRLTADEGVFALRLNHPHPDALGIDTARERQVLNTIAGQPWAPIVHHHDAHSMLSEWMHGEAPLGGASTRLHWLAHALESVHTITTPLPVIDIPEQMTRLAQRCGPEASAAQRRVDALLTHYQPPNCRVLCHHDWHPGNLLIGRGGWTLLDWEFAGAGDPRLDVGGAINGFALNSDQITTLSRMTGFGVSELKRASAIMTALERLWFAANPTLTDDAQLRLRQWIEAN